MTYKNDDTFTFMDIIVFGLAVIFIIIFIVSIIWGISAASSVYSVWSQSKAGEAELKKAEWTRQIAIKEAQAKKDSAIMLAQAEVARARGVAEANKIIGQSLKDNESYLRYLWIDNIHNTKNQIIYIPTEGSLPILEANRNKK